MGKKLGRPSKPDVDRKKKVMTLRLTLDEIDIVDKAAMRAGLTRSKWLREILLTQALKVIQ